MNSKKDITSEELLEQLNKLKQEISGLREENDQMKKELSESVEVKENAEADFEDIINLDDVLKKIEAMKDENSDFLTATSSEATSVDSEITSVVSEDKDFSFEDSMSRFEDLTAGVELSPEGSAPKLDVAKSSDLESENVIEELEAPIEIDMQMLDEILSETSEEADVTIASTETAEQASIEVQIEETIEKTEFEVLDESVADSQMNVQHIDLIEALVAEESTEDVGLVLKESQAIDLTMDPEFEMPTGNVEQEIFDVKNVDSMGETEPDVSFTQALSAIDVAQSFEETTTKSSEVSFTQALDEVIEEVQKVSSTEEETLNDLFDSVETTEEKKSEILDIPLESKEERNDRLSLTMVLSDTQELSTFMIESEIELEKQRRAEIKKFDPKSSNFDEDGNIVNPKKKSIYYIYIVIAAVLIAMILLLDTSIFTILTDREDPKVELTDDAIYVEVGQEYNLTDGITVSDDQSSEEYLMENVVVKSEPEFSADTIGVYEVTYSVKDEGRNKAKATQTVCVVPEGYELVLSVPTEDLVVQVGDEVNLMDGVSVSNGLDDSEELKSKVETSSNPADFSTDAPGTYEITYSISDSMGSVAVAKRNVVVEEDGATAEEPKEEPQEEAKEEETVSEDTTAPTVSIDAPDVTIAAGEAYDITTGVYASDDVSSVDYIWSHMQVASSPAYDPNTPGTYNITFTFTDEAGNSTTADRVIRVY